MKLFKLLFAVLGVLLIIKLFSIPAQAASSHITCNTDCSAPVFQDVGLDNDFFPYATSLKQCFIQNRNNLGLSCITPPLLCVPPANLDYLLPRNLITRAGLAKLAAVTHGSLHDIPHSQKTFSDVSCIEDGDGNCTDPFWYFIENLADDGLISGYIDGTFRPNTTATRGQAAKLVAEAAGISPVSTGQYFFDVTAANNTFYPWIQALAIQGALDGYDCDITVNDPTAPLYCDIQHSPWFIDGNATKIQVTKMLTVAAGITCAPFAACGQYFQDVSRVNPFYDYINLIGISHIMSGYSCGSAPAGVCVPPDNRTYFIPQNIIQRGQAAKIITNAAHLTGVLPPPPQHTFSDVPRDYVYWPYIEQAAAHGIISGYDDGTFLPGDNVLRRQFSLMIARAARYCTGSSCNCGSNICSDLWTFADVPKNDTFHDYIEAIYARGAINGYSCDPDPGNPESCGCANGNCQNRPYFRPANPLTRAQAAKITAIALVPPACVPPPQTPPPNWSCSFTNGQFVFSLDWSGNPTGLVYAELEDPNTSHNFIRDAWTGESSITFPVGTTPNYYSLHGRVTYLPANSNQEWLPSPWAPSSPVLINLTNCPPPPTTIPGPTIVVPTCIVQGHTGTDVNISWLNAFPPRTNVDIRAYTTPPPSPWPTYPDYANRVVSGLNTTAPDGFITPADTGNTQLTLDPDTLYRVRTWGQGVFSAESTFSIRECAPAITPPACFIPNDTRDIDRVNIIWHDTRASHVDMTEQIAFDPQNFYNKYVCTGTWPSCGLGTTQSTFAPTGFYAAVDVTAPPSPGTPTPLLFQPGIRYSVRTWNHIDESLVSQFGPLPECTPTPSPTPKPWTQMKNAAYQSSKPLYNTIPRNPIPFSSLTLAPGEPFFIVNNSSPVRKAGVVLAPTIALGNQNPGAKVSASGWENHVYYNYSDPIFMDFVNYVKARKQYNEIKNGDLTKLKANTINIVTTTSGSDITVARDDLPISPPLGPTDKIVVIVVGSNITIVPPSGIFNSLKRNIAILSVKDSTGGNIYIGDTTTTSDIVSEANGIFIADSIDIGTNPNLGLSISGNIITKDLKNGREWQVPFTNDRPSFFIEHNIDMYMSLLGLLSKSSYDWKQLR